MESPVRSGCGWIGACGQRSAASECEKLRIPMLHKVATDVRAALEDVLSLQPERSAWYW